MNTGNGFVGTYNDIIDEGKLKRLFIIKGAAGTGKSHLMKTLAKNAESHGASVKRFRCSSDAESLDCIIINNILAVLDGTPPHSLDLVYPGATSEIIDLSAFWNNSVLKNHRNEIINSTNSKKKYYNEAYNDLHTYSVIKQQIINLVAECVNVDKMTRAIARISKATKYTDKDSNTRNTIIRSIGMKGLIKLDTYHNTDNTIIHVEDHYGSAYMFMNYLLKDLQRKGYGLMISNDPIIPNLTCDIFIPSKKTFFTIDNDISVDQTINMQRFIYNDKLSNVRSRLRLLNKCSNDILESAKSNLCEAGKYHFELERIYGSAMDFDRLNEYTEDLSDYILSLLN